MSEDVGSEVKVPKFSGQVVEGVGDAEFAAAQDALFKPKPRQKQNGNMNGHADISTMGEMNGEVAPPEPAPKKTPPKKVDRAAEIFQKAAAVNEKVKEISGGKPAEPSESEAFDEKGLFDEMASLLEATEVTKKEPEKAPAVVEEFDEDKENNIKNLRQIVKSLKNDKTTLSSKLQEVETKLSSLPDPTGFTSELTKLKERIGQLEPFEKVFALHQNPDFKEKYIDGIGNLVTEMKQIARDYGLDDNITDDIISTNNRKDLDDLLTESFGNSAAQADIKVLKRKIDGLYKERKELEKTPQDTLAALEAQRITREAQNQQKRNEYLTKVVNDAWTSTVIAAAELPPEQRIYELTEIPGKQDHNDKVVRPTLATAQNMMRQGLTYIEKTIRSGGVIDKNFASWFAALCQGAAATQMINMSRKAVWEKYKEVEKSSKKDRAIERPGISGAPRGSAPSPSNKKRTGKDAAADIFFSTVLENNE